MDYEQEIGRAMREKTYYHFVPETGRYNWLASVGNIASSLGRPERTLDIKLAIEQSFTPDALTKVAIEREMNGKKELVTMSLLQAIKEMGIDPYIWTVGDPEWQKTKFKNCHADVYVDEDHYLDAAENKKDRVREYIDRHSPDDDAVVHLYLVDDKSKNIDEVLREMGAAAHDKKIMLHSYHLKLTDPMADPTAFYKWFQEEQKTHGEHEERIELFLDMDGVVIDTDRIMNGTAVANIAQVLRK